MKKTFIKRLATLMLFAITGSNLFSQGFYVYTKDGLRQDYQSENVDSIVFYEKVVGDIEPGGSDNFIDGHEYVDLGLPSGLKWATCNVGASKPEEYGGYYAWGETTTKNSYRLATYKWCEGTKSTMTKYCTQSNYGTVDSLTTLTSSDDVATIKWGSKWRIPTEEEMEELVKNCTWTWATQGGKKGMTVTGPNGNSIFLPATGLRDDTDVFYRGKYGYYWSATLGEFTSATACNLYFGSKNGSCQFCDRAGGLTVRPVTNGVENPDDENEEDEPIQEPDEEEVVIPEKPADTMEAVDLGLPSGLKWATCNVGATKPEEYGGYYAWGETEEKSDYDWDTYKWGISSSLTKYCTSSNYGTVDNKTVLDSEDDVAHVKLSDKWRMPTLDEIKELVNNCTWKWTTYNGVNGQLVTGPNGNSIFLPATGYRGGTDLYFRGSFGYYWSATLYEDNSIGAYGLSFSDSFHFWDRWGNRSYGFTVRPVTDGVENPDDENEEDKPIQKPDEEEVVTPEKPADTMEAVDLGLPCGLKWATCNVGASKPEEYGGYYAWGGNRGEE